MKKYNIVAYSLGALVLLSSCSGDFGDNARATTKTYFANEDIIEYKSKEKVENDFLKMSYSKFSEIEKMSIDIYLDDNVETIQYSKFSPNLETNKIGNVNEFDITFDENKIKEVAKYLSKKYSVKPVEPRRKNVNGVVSFEEGTNGLVYDEEILAEKLHIALKNSKNYVKIESYIEQPKYSVENLESLTDILGTYSTELGNSTEERIKNLTLASNSINNQIIEPNEEFSMNNLLGELTYDKGYVDAPVIIDGNLTDDIAGGVCQISSTLYNAVLMAELEVLERKNHSTMVSYVPFGFDATLVSGSIDFKFKNNTEAPIIINSEISNDKVEISIFGVENRPENRKIKYVNVKTEELETDEYEAILDKEKNPDFQEVTQEPKKGYIYEVKKVVYVDDKEVESEVISSSKYKARAGKITMGENAYNNYVKK